MKKLCLTLVLLLALMQIAAMLAACSGGGDAAAVTATAADTTSAGTEAPKEFLLPDEDFDGKEAVFYLRMTPDDWSADDVVSEGQDGSSINDAVYLRNVAIEDKYNLKITGYKPDSLNHSVYNPVSNSILAGESTYDVVTSSHYDAAKFMIGGMLLDLKTLEYIDLDREWWNPVLNKTISMANRQYYATGDISRVDNLGVRCFFFNKDLAANLGIDSPYEAANDGSWTFAKLFELATAGTADINGDGVLDKEDRFGITAQSSLGIVLAYSGGVSVTGKDAEDMPCIVINTERSIEVMNSVIEYLSGNKDIHYSDNWINTQNRFTAGQTLFQAEVLLLIEALRGSEVNIGIIPAPKYNEAQENYIHYLDAHCLNLYSVPVTVSAPDFSAFALEAMAQKSVTTLTPAFYDICLNGKYVRDEESSEMLDIIFASYIMDNAGGFGWGGMYSGVSGALKNGSEIVSVIESNLSKTQEAIDKSVGQFREVISG